MLKSKFRGTVLRKLVTIMTGAILLWECFVMSMDACIYLPTNTLSVSSCSLPDEPCPDLNVKYAYRCYLLSFHASQLQAEIWLSSIDIG